MTFLVPLTMFGWIVSGLVFCPLFGLRRGIAAVVLLGWLLLPMAGYAMDLLPAYTKTTSIVLSSGIALAVFGSREVAKFRPSWIDIPMLVFCVSPMASSLSNGLGPYDGYTVICTRLLTWGLPYLIGRITFGSPEGIRDLAIWTAIGGLVYAPLCLVEVRMSPQLSNWIYGIEHHDSVVRYGGFRPVVFMQSGLAVGLFMCSAAVVAVVLWRRKCEVRVLGAPASVVAVFLFAVAVLCKSTGAITLMLTALGIGALCRVLKSWIPVVLVMMLVPAYMGTRATGVWSGDSLVQAASAIGDDQAGSLNMRLANEAVLIDRATYKPAFGWGTWTKAGTRDDTGFNSMNAVTDGFWIIILGGAGFVGLFSFTAAMLFPVVMFMRRVRASTAFDADHAPAFALAIIIVMFLFDCLFNAMMNPLFPIAAGGLSGLSTLRTPAQRAVGGAARRVFRRTPRGRPREETEGRLQ